MSLLSYVIFMVPCLISNVDYGFFLTLLCHNTNDDGNNVDDCYFRPLSVNAVDILRVRIEVCLSNSWMENKIYFFHVQNRVQGDVGLFWLFEVVALSKTKDIWGSVESSRGCMNNCS